MRYLFNHWDRISSRIKNAPRVFLFFDYDGTLTPIVPTPEEARLEPGIKDSIKLLRKNPKFIIAIISGRSLSDIKGMVALRGIIYAGNHGLEILEGSRRILKQGARLKDSSLKAIYLALRTGLKDIKGARVEDKGCTLSVHFRLVRRAQRDLVKEIFNKIVRPYILSKGMRISSGKMVLEVRPDIDWDKGKAVLHLLAGNKKALPLYIGDDVTDRDGFRALKKKGISIFVGRPRRGIGADYFLRNPKDVARFIGRLLKL